jgi:uncharacterized protein (DUF2062 family)
VTLKRRINYILFRLRPRSVLRYFKKDLKLRETPAITLALSFGIGAFFSVCPTWGYQAALAGMTASVLKLNKIVAMTTTAISVAPLVPLILITSFRIGAFLLGETAPPLSFREFPGWKNLGIYTGQYLLGSLVLAAAVGVTAFFIMWGVLIAGKLILRKKSEENPEEA